MKERNKIIATNLPVSVVITAYNRDKYIIDAIESVLNSSFANFELLIIDDCSTDNTYKIAKIFEQKDSRIRLLKNNQNLGQFANRNKAILLSKGEYIKFVDSDDKIAPNGLELMVNAMRAFPHAGIGVPVSGLSNITPPIVINPHDSVLNHYLGSFHLSLGPTAVIFKKEVLLKFGLFEPSFGILADTLLNIKIACISPTVLFEKDLFFWRIHDEQVTVQQKDSVRMVRERFTIMKAIMGYKNLPLNKVETTLILRNFTKINTMHFLRHMYKGKLKDAFQIKSDTGLTIFKVIKAIINN